MESFFDLGGWEFFIVILHVSEYVQKNLSLAATQK